jgi:MFS family permease
MFADGLGVSATFLLTAPIAKDLGIDVANQAWIMTSYSLVFAATLLLSGRLADLYSPARVYSIGFLGLGILNLITAFMTDQYAFYVLRALSALLAVLTVPSSVNMMVQMYPDKEKHAHALSVYSLAGALSTTVAPILGGAFVTASWR